MGVEESGARSQNGGDVGVQESADFFQRSSETFGVSSKDLRTSYGRHIRESLDALLREVGLKIAA
jgi:hypothetical protein